MLCWVQTKQDYSNAQCRLFSCQTALIQNLKLLYTPKPVPKPQIDRLDTSKLHLYGAPTLYGTVSQSMFTSHVKHSTVLAGSRP